MEEGKIVRVHCNRCAHDTKHSLIASREQRGSEVVDDDPYHPIEISWGTTYDLLECRGCEDITVRRSYWFSEWNPEDLEVTFFPPRVSRRPPRWLEELEEDTQALLEEVYTALQSDSRRLAVMGARAVLDRFLVMKVGDKGTFGHKLKALQEQGYVSSRQLTVLEAALDAGHAAAHRGHLASSEEVSHVMDIVESLLHAGLLEVAAEDLRKRTPTRDALVKKGSGGGFVDSEEQQGDQSA